MPLMAALRAFWAPPVSSVPELSTTRAFDLEEVDFGSPLGVDYLHDSFLAPFSSIVCAHAFDAFVISGLAAADNIHTGCLREECTLYACHSSEGTHQPPRSNNLQKDKDVAH